MNYIAGYFSSKKVFHILEYFANYESAMDWVLERRNTRKDLIIFGRAELLDPER